MRLACRRLLATPQFLIFAVLSLAIGIGVTTSVYSILYSLIWKPIGIADPTRVVVIAGPGATGTSMRTLLSRPDFDDVHASLRSFTAIGASGPFYQNLVTPDVSDAVEGEAVTGDYFASVGVPAALGRTIEPRDDEGAARVIVLNHRVWQGRFQGDRSIVGRTVRLGGVTFEVVGVAARGFDGLDRMPRRTGAWIPLRAIAAFGVGNAAALDSRDRRWLTVVGHLLPGRSPATANGELASTAARLDADFPQWTPRFEDRAPVRNPRVWSTRPATQVNESESRMAGLIVALVALVLIVACTNLANLMMARGAARQREIAVRRALGAGRWRLVRELVVESAVIGVLGGGFSLVVIRVLLAFATIDLPLPGRMFSIEPELNLAALTVAGTALLLSLVVFGLEPALQLTRGRVTPDLAGGDGAIGVVRSGRQRAFIRWQAATSVTFFLISAVLARLVIVEAGHDSGVDVDRLAVATAYLPPQNWDQTRALRSMTAAAALLRAEPGIESVALATGAPFGLNSTTWAQTTTPDKPFTAAGRFEMADFLASTPSIFRTLGVAIVRGRAFDERDDLAAPRVMVVSEKSARTFFGTTDVVGRQLVTRAWDRPPIETWTVVGVARETDSGSLLSRGNDTLYVPLAQHYEPLLVVFARTKADPGNAARLIQKSMRRADPDVALGASGPASIVLAGQFFAAKIAASLAAALGALTLLLAMVGLYGVQSHLVARRTRELGVRMAIGASRIDIERMVVREGVTPVVQGIVLGMLLATLVRVALRAFVSGQIHALDPAAFALVPIPLLVAALVACYVPARRAARVDPNEALRHL